MCHRPRTHDRIWILHPPVHIVTYAVIKGTTKKKTFCVRCVLGGLRLQSAQILMEVFMHSVWYLSPFNRNCNVSIYFSTTFWYRMSEIPDHPSSTSYIRTDRHGEVNRSNSRELRKRGIKMEEIRKYARDVNVIYCSLFCLRCCWIDMCNKSTLQCLFLRHFLCLTRVIRHPWSPHTHGKVHGKCCHFVCACTVPEPQWCCLLWTCTTLQQLIWMCFSFTVQSQSAIL